MIIKKSLFKIGPFLTKIILHHPGNAFSIFTSRRCRKGLPPFITHRFEHIQPQKTKVKWRNFFALWTIHWWLAILFFIGASFFALSAAAVSFPQLLPWHFWQSQHVTTWGFFIGSMFFTSAGYLQWLESCNGDLLGYHNRLKKWKFFAFKPHNLGYLSSLTQFIGTICFNFNTGDALFSHLSFLQKHLIIWAPNILGSICFLVSSYLAIMENSHKSWSWQSDHVSWWIVMVNFLGSVFFMLSAILSFSGVDMAQLNWLATIFTMLGGLCFMAGAYLLLPEMAEHTPKVYKPS